MCKHHNADVTSFLASITRKGGRCLAIAVGVSAERFVPPRTLLQRRVFCLLLILHLTAFFR
jgi:hypothetical protein